MVWPFKRKPKVIDLRVANDFRAGDKVECIRDDWLCWRHGDPAIGDVLTVRAVTDQVNHAGVRRYWLWFGCTPDVGYAADYFRKLVESDDAALIQRIKSLGKAKDPTHA